MEGLSCVQQLEARPLESHPHQPTCDPVHRLHLLKHLSQRLPMGRGIKWFLLGAAVSTEAQARGMSETEGHFHQPKN